MILGLIKLDWVSLNNLFAHVALQQVAALCAYAKLPWSELGACGVGTRRDGDMGLPKEATTNWPKGESRQERSLYTQYGRPIWPPIEAEPLPESKLQTR